MTRAEIYKLRTHRSPWVCAAALLVGVLVPSIVLIWYTPSNQEAYTTTFTDTYDALSVPLGVVFGGWLLGTEYRQGTLKRFLATEPRRLRALATKGIVGAVAMATVFALVGSLGWVAARIVGSMHDVTVAWQGRTMLATALTAVIFATVAYSLSAIARSDSFGMVGTITFAVVIDPLLSLIPTVGKYTLGTALNDMKHSVSGAEIVSAVEHSTSAATFLLLSWVATFILIGAWLFNKRDV